MGLVLILAQLALAKLPCQTPPSGSPSAQPPTETITVTGQRADVETIIDRKSYAVANDLAARSGSVADVLRNIPSVQVDTRGNVGLQGEGSVTILVDGRPSSQFGGQNLGQALQAMPADRIDRIEVMTNPPAEYQAAGTGGIINLITKKTTAAGWTGSLRLSAETEERALAALSVGYSADRLSLTADLTYRTNPQSESTTLDRRRLDPATGLEINSQDLSDESWTNHYWQAHVGADYDLDDRTRLSSSMRFSTSRFQTFYDDQFVEDDVSGEPASGLDRTSREDWLYNTGDVSLVWRRTYARDHHLSFGADFSGSETRDDRDDLLSPTLPPGQPSSTQQVNWTDRSEHTRLTADYDRPFVGGKLKLGYAFDYAPNRTAHAAGSGGPDGPIVPDSAQSDVFLDNETDNAAYVSYERRLGKATVLAGLRAETVHFDLDRETQGAQTSHDYSRVFPNLHWTYDLGKGRQLTASYSWRTNSPTDRQLNPFIISRTPLDLQSGNPDLKPDDQSRYEVGFEDANNGGSTSVTLYYHHRGHAFNRLYQNLADGVVLEETINAGESETAGGELAFSGKLTPKLGYNASLDGYWIELTHPPGVGLSQTRSTITGFGHAGVNWRPTAKDLVQIDLVATARGLNPQGYSQPTYSANLGYRHLFTDNVSWILTLKDPFHLLRYRSVETIDDVENRRLTVDSSRSVSLTLVWNFAGKSKDQGFDYGSGDVKR